MLIYEMATSSTGVWDNEIVSRFGTQPAKMLTPAELTLVLLRFRFLKFAPIHAINWIESSPIMVKLRSKCSSAFIQDKKQKLLREDLDTSKKDRKLVSINKKASDTFKNVAPETVIFSRRALAPSPSNIEWMVQLLMFRHAIDGKSGNVVTSVQAIFRKLNLGNTTRSAAPLLDILLPQRSRYCSFVRTW